MLGPGANWTTGPSGLRRWRVRMIFLVEVKMTEETSLAKVEARVGAAFAAAERHRELGGTARRGAYSPQTEAKLRASFEALWRVDVRACSG